jgi:hypothetical protein
MSGVSAAGRVRRAVIAALVVACGGRLNARSADEAPAPPKQFLQAQAADPPAVRHLPPAAGSAADTLAPPAPAAVVPPETTLAGPVFSDPLPGTVEDQYLQELDAKKLFTKYTWRGGRITAFPGSLLWEPPLAVKRDPRMQFLATSLSNYASEYTLDTWIGGTQGLWRIEPEGADFAAQVDMFGVVLTRLSPDDLMLADYRFGAPVTWRWGWWHGKVGYEHTSAHLGDELIRATGRPILSWSKDEVVVGVGRYLGECLRVYGHYGYAFSMGLPFLENSTRTRSRFDVGAEYFLREPTGYAGTPFAAMNLEWRGDMGFTPNWTFQAGWMWRNPFQREAVFRVFAEYYTGKSPYGHLFREKEDFYSIGIAYDY